MAVVERVTAARRADIRFAGNSHGIDLWSRNPPLSNLRQVPLSLPVNLPWLPRLLLRQSWIHP
ncbi:hypothetical protein [Mesorhizobium shangrilense]|uniref:Uncharacterized protein n=1 Tax=Mesorhizobium shangrilense TaxID=460060 RepID=A0ABV2DNL1_9HYPH